MNKADKATVIFIGSPDTDKRNYFNTDPKREAFG
jgi:hypothetical protein